MVYMFLAPGFEETEAICPLDILRRAGVQVQTVAIGDSREVVGTKGITVTADTLISALPDEPPLMAVLPGGMPGASNLLASEGVCRILRATYDSGGFIGAICAAPLVPGELGLLRGVRAVCYPGYEQRLHGAVIEPGPVVRDGRFITAKAMGVSLRFGCELAAALTSEETARRIAGSVFA